MKSGAAAIERAPGRERHAVAGLLPALSLRARLSLLVGFVVAVVVGTAAFLEIRMFERTVESEQIDAARLTAIAVADDLELRGRSGDDTNPSEALHQFLEVNAAVRAITVVDLAGGQPHVVASTSSDERPVAVAAAQAAIASGDLVNQDSGSLRFVAVPLSGATGPMGVVVTTSMAAVGQIATEGRLIAVLVALPSIIIVTVVLDLLSRRLVHRRLDAIRDTMKRVAEGDLGARATADRADEIGAIVTGLNSMLAEMEAFSGTLQMRVREATAELRARNADMEEMYRRVLDLREALGRAERMAAIGQTAANVAHQIGTPLNLISGYVQMLLAETGLEPRTRERLDIIQRQIDHVATSVRGLLDRARRPAAHELIEPARLIERVMEIARPRLERSAVTLDADVDCGVTPIDADVVQLELALLNLVTNAIDAMPDGGRLSIVLRAQPDSVRLTVGDTGPGIAADVLQRIFEPWVTTKPPGRGTGLGLAIARDVIVAHGGAITAANRPGGGAEFTVTLPLRVPGEAERDNRSGA